MDHIYIICEYVYIFAIFLILINSCVEFKSVKIEYTQFRNKIKKSLLMFVFLCCSMLIENFQKYVKYVLRDKFITNM